MSRTIVMPLILFGMLLMPAIARLAAAAEVVIEANTEAETKAQPPNIAVTFRSPVRNQLFTAGQPIELTAVYTCRVAQHATLFARVTSAYGIPLLEDSMDAALPAGGETEFPLDFGDMARLPNGIYQVEAWAEGTQDAGVGRTLFSVWNGPLDHGVESFGISYAAPLNTARTWSDLDLFKQAGVGWMRFPLQGWLPQGQAVPAETEVYNQFIQEAGARNFKLLAAFTPKVTIDTSVNAMQADKEYKESMLAAVARYGFKVKDWELLTVKADPAFKNLKGIRYQDLAKYYSSLKEMDKSCRVVFSADNPLKWNALELFNEKIPAKGDVFAMRYNLIGIPELRTDPVPPVYALEEIIPGARTHLKQTPPLWVTEYGFDPNLGERLPEPTMQAALLSRALLINRGANIERTFWRYDPTDVWNLPLIGADGITRANYLALRTTLQMLDGVSSISDVPSPQLTIRGKVWALLLRYDQGKKKKPRYVLAAWLESRDSRVVYSLTLKTKAQRVTVTDLWGNATELQPTSNAAAFTVDAFPRFIDLGEYGDAELYSPFAYFMSPATVLSEGKDNILGFAMHNDQRLFRNDLNCEVYLRRWPGEEGVLKSEKFDLNPADSKSIRGQLFIPEHAKKGQIFEVNADIMLGTRRIGYLTMPVYYLPKAEAEQVE
ncbi:MAG: hypothetical protein ACYDCO_06175 [Armatimonadota bacterium]